MNSLLPALILFSGLLSACQTNNDVKGVPCAFFCPGAHWQVQRFRSHARPTTFPKRNYPLLDALGRAQNEWVVTSPSCLVLHSMQGQQTRVRFAQQGDTLTLLFSTNEPLRLLIQAQDDSGLRLQTLNPPQTELYLTRGTPTTG
jgi:hypothetical protein